MLRKVAGMIAKWREVAALTTMLVCGKVSQENFVELTTIPLFRLVRVEGLEPPT